MAAAVGRMNGVVSRMVVLMFVALVCLFSGTRTVENTRNGACIYEGSCMWIMGVEAVGGGGGSALDLDDLIDDDDDEEEEEEEAMKMKSHGEMREKDKASMVGYEGSASKTLDSDEAAKMDVKEKVVIGGVSYSGNGDDDRGDEDEAAQNDEQQQQQQQQQ